MTLVVRAPAKDILELAKTLFRSGEKSTELSTAGMVLGFVGWFVAITFLIAAAVIVKLMRSMYKAEIKRLADERDVLQERLLERSVKHTRLEDK
jgi:hypothetical protein